MGFSHEVTLGSSHPWFAKSQTESPEGTVGVSFRVVACRPFRTENDCQMLFHGLAPVAITYRHFVTEPHSNSSLRFFALSHGFSARKSLHGVGGSPLPWVATHGTSARISTQKRRQSGRHSATSKLLGAGNPGTPSPAASCRPSEAVNKSTGGEGLD